MHDYFEILGVARNARPVEIRRACCRRVHASHPDVWDGDLGPGRVPSGSGTIDRTPAAEQYDAAIDFIDVATLVDSIRADFFASPARRLPDDSSDQTASN